MQPLLAPFELHLKESLTGEQRRCSRTFKEKLHKCVVLLILAGSQYFQRCYMLSGEHNHY